MIDRTSYDGPITIHCDRCSDYEETRCTDFAGALAKVKAHGWRVRKHGSIWEHYCKTCSRGS
jgi:hypothetical protein